MGVENTFPGASGLWARPSGFLWRERGWGKVMEPFLASLAQAFPAPQSGSYPLLFLSLCSRMHTHSGSHEACFPESRKAIQADSASTSVGELHSIGSGQLPVQVGCDPQRPCYTWATNPNHSATESSELRHWGPIKGSPHGKAGILSVPVACLTAPGVFYRMSILHHDLTVSACLFPSRRTLEPGTLVSSVGKLKLHCPTLK